MKFASVSFYEAENKTTRVVPVEWLRKFDIKNFNKKKIYYCFYSANLNASPNFEALIAKNLNNKKERLYKVIVNKLFGKYITLKYS